MIYLPSVLAGTVLLAGVILFRKTSLERRNIPPWAAFLGTGTVVLSGLGCVAVFDPVVLGLTGNRLTPAPEQEVLPEGSYREGPLAAGEKFPPLEAADWLNGRPPTPGTPDARIIVLDLWAHW